MMKYRLILFTLILLILTGCSNPASAKKGGAEDVIVSETREARESLRQTMEEAKSVLPEEAVARIEESEKRMILPNNILMRIPPKAKNIFPKPMRVRMLR